MKIELEEKEVNYKLKCKKQTGYDTTAGKTYDCIAEYYHPDGRLLMYLIIDDAGDEHSVWPIENFEKVE